MAVPHAKEVCVIVGTRPEIIKMAPVMREIQSRDSLTLHLAHTNQHYDTELSGTFFESLDLPTPDCNLDVGSGNQGEQTAEGLIRIEQLIEQRLPSIVLAQGDTNAVLSTALATAKMPTLFGHVEAGIRSFDRDMPEEVNRVLADQVSDLAFAPTETAATNLGKEGITQGVYITGNTVVDACQEHLSFAKKSSDVLDRLDIDKNEYIVATIHRPRNTNNQERLEKILAELDSIEEDVILPAHPRTQKSIRDFAISDRSSVHIIEALDYLDFLKLEANASIIVTDSGGVQEEASILSVPCLTVRPNTERPETVEAGVNKLVEPDEIGDKIERIQTTAAVYQSMQEGQGLYGDGNASARIVDAITESI